ncbi:MAG: BatA domain-containing protein, partial [Planctomycetota bacterium]
MVGFLNPWLLLGIAAVGVPVLIHLLNRYRFRETDWAMMRFLIPATRIRSRQIKVQDVLLLVLRCLAVFLVMLALARPTIRPEGPSWPLGETRAGAVIVLDASFSMHHAAGAPGTARPGGRTRFERALEQVREIAATLKPGDPVTLVLVGSRVRVRLRNAPFDAERFGKELADLARSGPLPERLNLDTLPGLLLPLVKELKAVRREVYLVTDAQASQWRSQPAEGRAALTGVEEAKEHRAVSVGSEMRELARAAHGVFLLPVGGVEAENLAVTRLELASGVLRRGAMARYAITVRNFGARPHDGATVVCQLDGTTVDERSLGFLAPGEAKTVSMFVPLNESGTVRVSAHLGSDPLELDNARYAVAEVRERVSVLCVDGDPSGEPFEGAADFVVAALSTGEFDPAEESLTVRSVPWLALPSESIADHDVVILVDVPDVPEAQVEALYDLVRGGGGLIVFVGDNTKPHTWNEKMRVGRESLLPADLVEVVRDDVLEPASGRRGLTPLDPTFRQHPLCLALRSLPLDLVSETRFRRHMSVRAHPEAEAVLKLAGKGDPLLLEKRVGRGRVLLFTSTADRDWNNIVINPVFPILMQQAVAYLTRAQHERPLTVGQPIVLHVPGSGEQAAVT